jgi:hypothetical protein
VANRRLHVFNVDCSRAPLFGQNESSLSALSRRILPMRSAAAGLGAPNLFSRRCCSVVAESYNSATHGAETPGMLTRLNTRFLRSGKALIAFLLLGILHVCAAEHTCLRTANHDGSSENAVVAPLVDGDASLVASLRQSDFFAIGYRGQRSSPCPHLIPHGVLGDCPEAGCCRPFTLRCVSQAQPVAKQILLCVWLI